MQYNRGAETAISPRDLEAAAFVFVNRFLEEAKDNHERTVALGRNHRLWTLLLTDIGLSSNALPPILKKDLISIGSWSMSYSIVAMGRSIPMQPLIDINRDMIEALEGSQKDSKLALSSTEGAQIKFTAAI